MTAEHVSHESRSALRGQGKGAGASSIQVAHDASYPDGEAACLRIWDRIADLDPHFWLAQLPANDGSDFALFPSGHLPATMPYAAISCEVEHALTHGVRRTTPLALALLASLVLGRRGYVDAAVRLGQAALALASRDALPCVGQVHALYACSILPHTDDLDRMNRGLADMVSSQAILPAMATRGVGTAFIAGMPLQQLIGLIKGLLEELSVDEHEQAGAGLAVTFAFLRQLECGEFVPPPTQQTGPGTVSAGRQEAEFAYWLARLQAAWYAYDRNGALHALRRAASLDGPLVPLMERMAMHFFGVLVLAEDDDAPACESMWTYCSALTAWGCERPASGAAMAALANAVRNRSSGSSMSVLQGCEAAAACAMRHDQDWLAALAWEEAARRAQEWSLASAMAHYRGQALASYERWGAWGRAALLRRRWRVEGEAAVCTGEASRRTPALRGVVGEVAISIAHEVNQPLAAISLHAAAARKWLRRETPDIERALASLTLISTAGRHAEEVVRGVQDLASCRVRETQDTDIDHSIRQALLLLRQPLRRHRVSVGLALGLGNCTARVNGAQLQQVVTNLLVNAIQALEAVNGQRRIRVQSRRDGDHVEIVVADNGPGVPMEHRERIFTSKFSTKANNSGVGLSICSVIADSYGGRIMFRPCEPRGACFIVRLPIGGRATISPPPG